MEGKTNASKSEKYVLSGSMPIGQDGGRVHASHMAGSFKNNDKETQVNTLAYSQNFMGNDDIKSFVKFQNIEGKDTAVVKEPSRNNQHFGFKTAHTWTLAEK